MEKQLIEMMGKLMEQMSEMKSELKGDMQGLRTEMNDRFNAVDERLDTVDQHLTKIDGSIHGVGEHFEELSKNTVQLQDEMKKELKYITYKIHALDREVFMRTDSTQ